MTTVFAIIGWAVVFFLIGIAAVAFVQDIKRDRRNALLGRLRTISLDDLSKDEQLRIMSLTERYGIDVESIRAAQSVAKASKRARASDARMRASIEAERADRHKRLLDAERQERLRQKAQEDEALRSIAEAYESEEDE